MNKVLNWVKAHKIWTAVIVVVLIAAGASAGGSKSSNTTANNTPAGTIQPTANPTTTASNPSPSPSPAAPKPTVALSLKGNGSNKTVKFHVNGDWDIHYTYDCRAFGQSGNFAVQVYGADGGISLSNDGPNEIGVSGTSVTHNHNGGDYYLQILSECAWTIKVVSLNDN